MKGSWLLVTSSMVRARTVLTECGKREETTGCCSSPRSMMNGRSCRRSTPTACSSGRTSLLTLTVSAEVLVSAKMFLPSAPASTLKKTVSPTESEATYLLRSIRSSPGNGCTEPREYSPRSSGDRTSIARSSRWVVNLLLMTSCSRGLTIRLVRNTRCRSETYLPCSLWSRSYSTELRERKPFSHHFGRRIRNVTGHCRSLRSSLRSSRRRVRPARYLRRSPPRNDRTRRRPSAPCRRAPVPMPTMLLVQITRRSPLRTQLLSNVERLPEVARRIARTPSDRHCGSWLERLHDFGYAATQVTGPLPSIRLRCHPAEHERLHCDTVSGRFCDPGGRGKDHRPEGVADDGTSPDVPQRLRHRYRGVGHHEESRGTPARDRGRRCG